MDAVLGNIFLAIQQQLVAGCPALKFIDLDTHQLEFKDPGDRPMVLLPCALIDFTEARYTDLSDDIQSADDVILQVRIGVDPFTQATAFFSDTKIANALNYFNIEHTVNLALHGWSNSQYFGPLCRISMKSEFRNDKLRVRVLHYKFSFIDNTAMPVTTTVEGNDLEVEES
jgi:hypothetical protein